MKKIGVLLLSLVLVLSLSACTENSEGEMLKNTFDNNSSESMVSMEDKPEETEEISESRVLIAYFGRWGNTEFSDDVDASTSASIVIGRDGNLQVFSCKQFSLFSACLFPIISVVYSCANKAYQYITENSRTHMRRYRG